MSPWIGYALAFCIGFLLRDAIFHVRELMTDNLIEAQQQYIDALRESTEQHRGMIVQLEQEWRKRGWTR